MLLTAFHISGGSVAYFLVVTIFLASVALRNGGSRLLGFYFKEHDSQFSYVEDFLVLGCIG